MTMFDGGQQSALAARIGEAQYSARKECKPDYEAMILSQRSELERMQRFYNAIAELVGELVGELEASKRMIEELIERQEKDTKKD